MLPEHDHNQKYSKQCAHNTPGIPESMLQFNVNLVMYIL